MQNQIISIEEEVSIPVEILREGSTLSGKILRFTATGVRIFSNGNYETGEDVMLALTFPEGIVETEAVVLDASEIGCISAFMFKNLSPGHQTYIDHQIALQK